MQQVDTTLLGLSPEDAKRNPYIASMGLYVFRRDFLLKLLSWIYPTANDFGSEIIPAVITEQNVQVRNIIRLISIFTCILHFLNWQNIFANLQAYIFRDYWEDIGTIKTFYDANLALAEEVLSTFSFNTLAINYGTYVLVNISTWLSVAVSKVRIL